MHDIKEELIPLNEVISNRLSPSIIGPQVSETEREVLLSVMLGGMGIDSISSVASEEYFSSKEITAPLAAISYLQGNSLTDPEEVDQ